MMLSKLTEPYSELAIGTLYSRLGRTGFGLLLGTLAWLLPVVGAWAVPIDPNLAITMSMQFFPGFSAAATGGATQSALFSLTQGGATSTTTVDSALTVSGSNPLGGLLTNLGDGIDATFNQSGSGSNASTQLQGNSSVAIANSSLTDTFKVTLKIDYNNRVDATGSNAFAQSWLTFSNNPITPSISDLLATKLVSDTVFGNETDGVPDNVLGGLLTATGMPTFDFTIGPNSTLNLYGAYQQFKGGALASDSRYTGFLDSKITVDAIMNVTNPIPPTPTPEPGTLVLTGTGLVGVALARRRRRVQV